MLSRLALIFACIFALTSAVYAQDDLDALPSSSETVQIEVLVFRFPGKGAGSELKPGQAAASNVGQAILNTNAGASGLYSEVDTSQRRLSGAMARIQASSDLKPLLFTAWRQEINSVASDSSRRFRLRANRPAHFEETLYFDHPALGALVRVDLKAQ